MKKFYFLLFFLPVICFAQTVSITKIIETDCSAPFVKTLELYVTGTVDFRTEVQLNYMENGGLWGADKELEVADFASITDRFIYIVRDVAMMQAEFPSITFETNASVTGFNTIVTNTATNGNDGYQLILNGVVVSQFGKTDTDAANDPVWEHTDSVASRIQNIADNGLWDETHWVYSGKNSLDGNTKCKGGAGIEAYLSNLGGDFPLQYGSNNHFTLTAGTGSFTFEPQAPLNRNPLEVFYHIPEGDVANMPILMSFHGASRNGGAYRNYWIQMANDNGFIVIAPEFSTVNYPGLGDNYNMSNIFDDGDNPTTSSYNDKNEWTCAVLDPLFDYVVAGVSSTQQTYSAWGHSAGAQFLHRLLTYLPSVKIAVAVCSNAGWYTTPENTVSYPYGILNGQLPEEDLVDAFSKKLIVHLGRNDNTSSTSAGGPRNNTILNNQQGYSRLARGRYYFETSAAVAQDMNTSFNWEKRELAGVGHNSEAMANDALRFFQSSLLSTERNKDLKTIQIYPNPAATVLSFDNSKIAASKMDIYAMNGKLVATFNFTHFDANQEVNISKLLKGIYFLKVDIAVLKFIKK